MKLPALVDYQEAVQHPSIAFVEPRFKQAVMRINQQGQPAISSGGHALTFEATVDNAKYAIRCFHKQGDHLRERYAEIASMIQRYQHDLRFLINVEYVPQGIRVNGATLPIVRMPWIIASRLDYWVEDNLNRPDAIERVRQQLANAVTKMRAAGLAHGDLQHGNILVNAQDAVSLVDYDGMFVPELARFGALESGHASFQHPGRRQAYDQQLDVFSAAVIDLSLDALRHEPSLWDSYYNDNNLLFSATDFAAPERSPLFARLAMIKPLAERTRRLMDACAAEFGAVSAVLAGERVTRRVTPTAPALPAAMRTTNRQALLDRVGDEVTVVGQVKFTKIVNTSRGPMSLINFGDFRRGDFTIVAFSRITPMLRQEFGAELESLRGEWVTITGLVTSFRKNFPLAPQIELKRQLRVIDEAQAQAILSPRLPAAGAPAPNNSRSGVYRMSSPRTKPKPAPTSGTNAQTAKRYSQAGFRTAATPPAQPVPPRTVPPQPVPPQPSYVQPPPPNLWAPPTRHRRGFWQRLRDRLGL